MHTAYLKIVDGRARFTGGSAFRTFLFGVIRNTASEERRRRAIRAMLPLTALRFENGVEAVDAPGASGIETEETSRALVNALNTLSTRQREVLALVFYHDLSIADAAQVLGVSLGSARVHYERGKANLRKLIGNGGTV